MGSEMCIRDRNCTTFCPTSGAPYRDKPRLYLDRGEFEAQTDNAFMIFRDGDNWSIDARVHGKTEHLDLNDMRDDVDELHAAMCALLSGVQTSMPFLPACEA